MHDDFGVSKTQDGYRKRFLKGVMKRLVTEFHAFDIRELAPWWLHPFTRYEWVWRTQKSTQGTSVSVTVLQDSLQLVFLIRTQRMTQTVGLTYSTGPRGGKRRWFICHGCQRRVGVLYHAEGLPFRCRICHDLVYPSQYVSRDQSYGRRHRCLSFSEECRLRVQDTKGG